jgi:glycosyltransferase involved in cell wall biosynthesis
MMTRSVCLVAPGELFGGVETQILGLARLLADSGAAAPTVALFHDRELAARLREQGCDVAILPSAGSYDIAPARTLSQLLEASKCDMVHVHGYRASVTCAVCPAARRRPVIKTVHGLTEPSGTPIVRLKSRFYRDLEVWSTHHLRAHVCYVTADIMRRSDRAHAGLPRRVIHNGIAPLDRAGRPRPAGLDPGLFHAGIVGRVSEVKGIVHALRALTSPVVPAQVRLDVIGTGPLLDALRHEAGVLGVAERVRFHGFQRDILDWIAHLDVLLMPSLHEGLPYTLLEAMSLGVPAIASRVGGLAEVLRDGETGLLVEVGDAAGLAGALAKLAGDPGYGREMGEAAAREQRARYTLDRMVDDYLAVYAAAVAAR